jgi:hypothetical protein
LARRYGQRQNKPARASAGLNSLDFSEKVLPHDASRHESSEAGMKHLIKEAAEGIQRAIVESKRDPVI